MSRFLNISYSDIIIYLFIYLLMFVVVLGSSTALFLTDVSVSIKVHSWLTGWYGRINGLRSVTANKEPLLSVSTSQGRTGAARDLSYSRKRIVYTVAMLRKSLANIGLRVHRPQPEGIQRAAANYGDIRRRHASSSTAAASSSATIMGDNVKLKTIDDLGGPSFLTTLNWLFVKGYFKTTQQMQVSEREARDRCVCVPCSLCCSFCLHDIWPVVTQWAGVWARLFTLISAPISAKPHVISAYLLEAQLLKFPKNTGFSQLFSDALWSLHLNSLNRIRVNCILGLNENIWKDVCLLQICPWPSTDLTVSVVPLEACCTKGPSKCLIICKHMKLFSGWISCAGTRKSTMIGSYNNT